jgi:hypothetical protein
MGSEYPKGGGRYSWGIRPSGGGGDIPRLFVPRWRYSSTFLKILSCPPQNMSLPLKCPPKFRDLAPPLNCSHHDYIRTKDQHIYCHGISLFYTFISNIDLLYTFVCNKMCLKRCVGITQLFCPVCAWATY